MLQFLRVNIKKMMVSSENARKVIEKRRRYVFCTVCRKDVISNSNLCQFCRFWIHKIFSGIRDELKKDSEFECQACASEETDTIEKLPGI